jgi:hypothetical protein
MPRNSSHPNRATIAAAKAATEQTKLFRQEAVGTKAALPRIDFDINATGIRIIIGPPGFASGGA